MRKLLTTLLIVYLVILIWILLFKMNFSIQTLDRFRSVNLIPFDQSRIVNGRLAIQELAYNTIAFVPLGVYVAGLRRHWGFIAKVLPALVLSLAVESLQYVLAIGALDITDVLTNTTGGALGVAVYGAARSVLGERTDKVITVLAAVVTVLLLTLVFLLALTN